MVEATVLSLVDGVRVVVPDSLNLITPYVLREQLDFFEDELRFVRQLLQPGQKVVDIGANYGVYTLPMAKKVGPTGHVWAFEPTSSTAEFLAQGIAANGFGQVTLEKKAVSSRSGTAKLVLESHSEANSISHEESSPAVACETVPLVTLDQCLNQYRWVDIELIKIDAEGEECNIVVGGRRFLTDLAPLVQYELRKADSVNSQLIQEFAALGYDSYRLVPGLNVLVPLHVYAIYDPYLLNLFSCKPLTRQTHFHASRTLSCRSSDLSAAAVSSGPNTPASDSHHWRRALALPYAVPFASQWEDAEKSGGSAEVIRALALYSRSRDSEVPLAKRFCALEESFSILKMLCAQEPTRLRLASLARTAHDFGERATSVNALKSLLTHIHENGVDVSEPFLAPLERFDSIVPDSEPARWLVAAVLEQLERRERFSSFYAGPNALERLEDIHALGLGSAGNEPSPGLGSSALRRRTSRRERLRRRQSGRRTRIASAVSP